MNESKSILPRPRGERTWAKCKLLKAAATFLFFFLTYPKDGAPGQVHGDLLVGHLSDKKLEPMKHFVTKLQSDEPELWVAASKESNTFGANCFVRVGRLLKTDSCLSKAVGVVPQFSVLVEGLSHTAFTVSVRQAAKKGQTETEDFFKSCGGRSLSEEYVAWFEHSAGVFAEHVNSPFLSL